MVTQELLSDIKSELQKGTDAQTITQSMLAKGYSQQDIIDALNQIAILPHQAVQTTGNELEVKEEKTKYAFTMDKELDNNLQLLPDEQIEYKKRGFVLSKYSQRQSIIILTNKRFIFLKHRLFGSDSVLYVPYSKVTQIDFTQGGFVHLNATAVKVSYTGGSVKFSIATSPMRYLGVTNPKETDELIDLLRQKVSPSLVGDYVPTKHWDYYLGMAGLLIGAFVIHGFIPPLVLCIVGYLLGKGLNKSVWKTLVFGLGGIVILGVLFFFGARYILFPYNRDINSASSAWEAGNYTTALTNANQALTEAKTDQDKAIAHYWIGLSYYRMQNLPSAETEEMQAVQLSPHYAAPYATLSAINLDKKNYTQALQYAQQSAQFDPKYDWAYNDMGLALLTLGRKQEGIQALQKAVQLAPNNTAIQNNLNMALRQ